MQHGNPELLRGQGQGQRVVAQAKGTKLAVEGQGPKVGGLGDVVVGQIEDLEGRECFQAAHRLDVVVRQVQLHEGRGQVGQPAEGQGGGEAILGRVDDQGPVLRVGRGVPQVLVELGQDRAHFLAGQAVARQLHCVGGWVCILGRGGRHILGWNWELYQDALAVLGLDQLLLQHVYMEYDGVASLWGWGGWVVWWYEGVWCQKRVCGEGITCRAETENGCVSGLDNTPIHQ